MRNWKVIKNPRPLLKRVLREIYYFFYDPICRLYWRVVRTKRQGVKTIVMCGDKLLLVRIGYAHKGWVIPGGAVDLGEQKEEAAKRELEEETGIKASDLMYIATREYQKEFVLDVVHYFYVELESELDMKIDDQEIKDAGWFPIDYIPQPHSPRLLETIELFKIWKHGI